MAVIERRFGDEKSTLLDEFERLSFEAHAAQLHRAMLRRNLSEPGLQRSPSRLISIAPSIPLVNQVMQGPHHANVHGLRFHRVLKKLLKPIFGRKKMRAGRKYVSEPCDIMFCKDFSRSLRF